MRCVICHSVEIAVQQRFGPQGWSDTLDRMIRYGAPIPPEDKQTLMAYLLEHYRDPNGRGRLLDLPASGRFIVPAHPQTGGACDASPDHRSARPGHRRGRANHPLLRAGRRAAEPAPHGGGVSTVRSARPAPAAIHRTGSIARVAAS